MSRIANLSRKPLVLAACLAITGGAVCTYVVRADDKMSDMMKMGDTKVSADESKMAMEQLDKMKKEASDDSDKMKMNMAKMMVMEHMSMSLAADADFQKSSKDLMDDETFKKLHEEASTMAKDPEQMKKMEDEITSDSKEMKEVVHHAMMMEMMHDKMSGGSSESMGQKMMDKMNSK